MPTSVCIVADHDEHNPIKVWLDEPTRHPDPSVTVIRPGTAVYGERYDIIIITKIDGRIDVNEPLGDWMKRQKDTADWFDHLRTKLGPDGHWIDLRWNN